MVNLAKFCSPIDRNNVTLIIEDKRLRISKEYLAIHSPYFSAMFFGDCPENGKDEIEIKEVLYEEFIDVVQLIFT
ncbi:hypothetical protein PMAYCL1PPCAC_25565, partial [Pristionchus mayeri]